ncbi:multiheme c-type cytochrome [Saccharicrinis fermentans]|uniref:Tetratricopeptide repeat protein n=1 Tax=Saccharicrinis fermentans DSM 9555 = JCM 21142 TaxID=869213 RepID=W7YRT4_9BACT|nr:multiheme c-type cytochrome [Saccharicrinis fermentans]GAF05124.1 tetratricopeptide repeat protein [Saccharicrinis fermentans DSM 9555 = JCM 21142]
MENRTKIERISLIAIIVAIVSVPTYTVIRTYSQNETETANKAHYVGRETCIECHMNEYNEWLGSDHDKAMDHANDSTVLGDFNNKSIEYNGMTHRFYKRDGRFFVETDGESGQLEEFEIKYTFGYYPLQQYLVEFDKGRLQTLPLTWNSKDSVWYHMADEIYKDEMIESDNWLHWTNQAQNWNGMCADCHSTNLVKGYDVETDSYHTTWSEIDVSCEACHGPASEHLKWAAKAEYARSDNDNYGLVVQTSGIDNKQYVDLCVRCHTRRGSISDFEHSPDIYNHTIPNLPTGENYHIDGQILSEDYVYGSFTQSKMYMRDVKCNDCHNVHSTKRLFEDNRLCTQCHRADDYDTYNHHFHKGYGEDGEAVIADDGVKFEVGDGTRCINCHMPAQFYMGVDYRNDHSIRIPRPDLTKEIGTPNACNQCHADKSTDWAIKYVNKWHGEGRPSQYGTVFKEAQSGSQEGFDGLVHIYNDEVYPEIVRAIAIQMLGSNYQSKAKNILIEALHSFNGHIRFNALQNLMVDDQKSLNAVFDLLNDQTKAIRIECASKLSGLPKDQIPAKYKKSLDKAKKEYLEALKYSADFPTGKFNLANYYYNNQEIDKAEKFYKKALEQDNKLHTIKINLALLYNSKGEPKKAELLLKDYLKHMPEDGNTMFTYALFLSEQKRYDESMTWLLKASKYSPNNPRIFYNIAMMYDFRNNMKDAETYLQKAVEINPADISYYMGMLNLYIKYQQTDKTKNTAKEILEKFPNIPDKEHIEAILKQ